SPRVRQRESASSAARVREFGSATSGSGRLSKLDIRAVELADSRVPASRGRRAEEWTVSGEAEQGRQVGDRVDDVLRPVVVLTFFVLVRVLARAHQNSGDPGP